MNRTVNRQPSTVNRTVNREPSTVNRVGGFTLVEMLVVILLIAVLAGIVFRMTSMANEQSAKAVTLARLAKLQAAIEEFYAEYGRYPPVPYYPNRFYNDIPQDQMVQPVLFEYPDSVNLSLTGKAGQVGNADHGATDWLDAWKKAPLFTFGLMSFLLPRYNHEDLKGFDGFNGGAYLSHELLDPGDYKQWKEYNTKNKDNPRDIAACRRWWPYISDVLDQWERASTGSIGGYTNLYATVLDGWNHEFYYSSPPPDNQTYELYAISPDGKKIEAHAGH